MTNDFPNSATRQSSLGLVGILLGALCLIPACAPTPPQASPGERGAPNGLEVRCWVVDDSINDRISFATLGEALLPYRDRPTGIADDQLRLWRANGLRVVAVPIAELDLLHDRLRTIGHASEQWFVSLPRWTPLAGGIAFHEAWNLSLDNGPLELPPGQVRLLGRAWLVPVEPPLPSAPGEPTPPMGAALSLELLPQFADADERRETLSKAYGIDPRPTPEQSGLNFDRCTLSTVASSLSHDALVIVPEDPGVEWKALPPAQPRVLPTPEGPVTSVPTEPEPSKTVEPPTKNEAPAPAAPSVPVPAGPYLNHPPTLGEAMLADVGGRGLARRVIVVIVPRVPETFELIPR